MSHVALGLAGPDGSDADAAERISTKFPTSAIAVLQRAGAVEQRWNSAAPR